jgi:hypothetical protein
LLAPHITDPDLLDARFFVTVPLLLQSLMLTYPFTVRAIVRSSTSEVRNKTSAQHLYKVMVKALTTFMSLASMRSQKSTAWAVTMATVMEFSKLSDSESNMFARLGLNVSYRTLLNFVKKNGQVFHKRIQEVGVSNS